MAKINFFETPETFKSRIIDYVDTRILRKKISCIWDKQIAANNEAIKGLEKTKGSAVWEQSQKDIATLMADNDTLREKKAEQLRREATFANTKADNAFKKAVEGLSVSDWKVGEAIDRWFWSYGINTEGTNLKRAIWDNIGAKEDWIRFVTSDGTSGLSADKNRALIALYWTTFELAVESGAIKPAHCPEEIREFVEAIIAKKNAKKSKKSAK